jgi:tRNA-splicing ligase RtcB (3'-phosphate/5'-hydroxy nucleic acid ligase)
MVRMEIFDNQIPVFGTADDRTLNQIRVCARTADKVALMPDNHLGYGVPIGGVVAYRDAISPTGVGFDIGCGNKAVRLDMPGSELRANIAHIMDDVWTTISFGVGRKNNEAGNEEIRSHVLFDDEAWKLKPISPLKQMARNQLGTVGSGNHYVDLFTDEEERVWIGVHFGSRGLGHKTATWFLEAAGAKDGMEVEPCVLSTATDLGADYLEAMRLAGDYAYAGRDWVCARVAAILGAPIVEEVHNHHNYAWREEHGGEMLWVVRKGATPAFPGQRGFVGGTMGEQSVILEGVENEHARYSLYSTVHGAGRAMGRREAAGVIDRKTGAVKRAGKVTPEMMRGWVDRAGIELRGAGLDESPDCYKRLDGVLEAVGDTVRILHRLTPVGVAMAGANEFDPYKD